MGLLDAIQPSPDGGMGLLGSVLSRIDAMKRRASGLLDPGAIQQLLASVAEDARGNADLAGQGYANAGSVMPGVAQTGAQQTMQAGMAPAMGLMTVYHGSPHLFDKFDASKIGTGEGAQAYGQGIYFADNPGVARSYTLAGNGLRPFVDNAPANTMRLNGAESMLLNMYHNRLAAGLDNATAAAQTEKWGASHPQIGAEKAVAFTGRLSAPQGNLYSVDIPDDAIANMLHWDKPLSDQPPAVRAALGADDPQAGLAATNPDMTGQQLYNELSLAMGDRAKAAQFLQQQGIPGIRYLDAGSRAGGDGTYNTVLFDDSLARILGRE